MSNGKRISVFLTVTLLVLLARPVFELYEEGKKALSEDPTVYEQDILAFEQQDRSNHPPENAVVFAGSSSIRLWNTLKKDMAPIPVIQRGFGGAKINDVVHYAERIINRYRPRAVVIFAGTNDITPRNNKPPEKILASYKELVGRIRAELPATPIYFIAITPSPSRWKVWQIAEQANELIAHYSAEDANLHIFDTGKTLMNEEGEPDRRNYIFDGLHLSARGYEQWTSVIKPELLKLYPELGE